MSAAGPAPAEVWQVVESHGEKTTVRGDGPGRRTTIGQPPERRARFSGATAGDRTWAGFDGAGRRV